MMSTFVYINNCFPNNGGGDLVYKQCNEILRLVPLGYNNCNEVLSFVPMGCSKCNEILSCVPLVCFLGGLAWASWVAWVAWPG